MRKVKLLAMLLMLGMALNVFVGCSGGTSAPTTEEVTTTTVAPTPTPTPEPTATPTPTPPVEKWVIDERLCKSSWFAGGSRTGMYTIWTFDDKNGGYIYTMLASSEGEGFYYSMRPVVFKYSVISDGVIRIVYSDESYSYYKYSLGDKNYLDYKYGFDGPYLQLESMDSDGASKTTYSRRAWNL